MSRFDYVKYDEISQGTQSGLKGCFHALSSIIEQNLKDGRAKSLVLTKLEEAYMWVGKAIRDEQIARGADAPLQEERKNG